MKSQDRSYKHRELFDAGVAALRGFGAEGKFYRCPICQSDFDERAIRKDSPTDYCLTLEHAPPDSIGGKVVALTCKNCNNDLGSRLDSQIAAREKFFCFIDPKRPNPKPFAGKVTLGKDAATTINVQISGKISDRIKIRAGRNNKPPHLSGALESLNKINASGGAFHGELKVPAYNERLAKLAFLKSAFLCLFGKFGYTYALSKPARYISDGFLEKGDIDVVMLQPITGYENSILVSEESGVCFVGFGEFLLVCPWVNASIEKYAAACGDPASFLGTYRSIIPLEMPLRLEAILDNRLRKTRAK